MSDIGKRHDALMGLAGGVNEGLAEVTVTVKRPDPRLASSWCREGVTHDHGACGAKWNNHDPREIEEAARFADDLGEKRRQAEAAKVPGAWLDEIADLAESFICDGVRRGGVCDGHLTGDTFSSSHGLFAVGRCEMAHRVQERIRGLRAGVDRPEDREPADV